MSQSNIVTSTWEFLIINILPIIVVVVLFSALAIYIELNNIKFINQKTTLEKVIVVEKITPQSLDRDAEAASSTPEICQQLDNKSSCTSLGSCVWVTTKDGVKKIEKCKLAASLGTGSKEPKGSDGPTDMCYCSNKGKFIPWEEYYYLDGDSTKTKKARICSAIGKHCTI